jgi:hypothetical protein
MGPAKHLGWSKPRDVIQRPTALGPEQIAAWIKA